MNRSQQNRRPKMVFLSWFFLILGVITVFFNIIAGAFLIVIGVLLVVFSNQNAVRKEREQSTIEGQSARRKKRGDY